MYKKVIVLLSITLIAVSKYASCQILTFDSIISTSQYIFEGTVIDGDSVFLADQHDWILTAHKIQITKVIKGDLNCGIVKVVTLGGMLDSNHEEYSPNTLHLYVGDSGVFNCSRDGWQQTYGTKDNPFSLSAVGDRFGGFLQYGVYYGDSPDPNSDSCLPYWDGSNVKFFMNHNEMFLYYQGKVGHKYYSCIPIPVIPVEKPTLFSCYPNPTSDQIRLNIPGTDSFTISIYDMSGKQLMNLNSENLPNILYHNMSGYKTETVEFINLNGLKSGIYLGRVISGGITYDFKIVKQ